jgi:VIT1/CCC1 family predicted Fe2+/Mn2+ transporter
VLGANDGIVSVAAVVVGVAGATSSIAPIVTAGVAAVVGGAISMALGEYVSVSSQSDSHQALIDAQKKQLIDNPEQELAALTDLYLAQGVTATTARQVAVELTSHDALSAHLSAGLHLDQTDLVSPWHAAFASAGAFLTGAILPMLAILIPPEAWRIPVTFAAVLIALAVTGTASARFGGSSPRRATVRVVFGGALALVVTYVIGSLLGTSGIV